MKDRIIFWAGTTAITGLIGWMSFTTIALMTRPDVDTVRDMIRTDTPYVQDKRVIDMKLDRLLQLEGSLTNVIDRNTEAINQLRVQMAKMEPR